MDSQSEGDFEIASDLGNLVPVSYLCFQNVMLKSLPHSDHSEALDSSFTSFVISFTELVQCLTEHHEPCEPKD